ncbi:MAG: hypothetical protein ABW168_15765 [Sedimenticola sp.]
MSSSRKHSGPTIPLSIEAVQRNGTPSGESHIQVFDAWDKMVLSGEGSVAGDMPRGIYTARISRAGHQDETSIKLREAKSVQLQEPLRSSAIPSFDTVAAHEYYSYTSAHWSVNNTRAPIGDNPQGRLFIFIRSRERSSYQGQSLTEHLSLSSAAGELVTDFSQEETESNKDGWLAFSAPATPGLYLLTYGGHDPRELPLYVFQNLSTQFFVMFHERLLFDTASLLLDNVSKPFNPDDKETQAFDTALKGLQIGRNLLPQGMMQILLHGKFDHPMLGLIGAHILLLGKKIDPNLIDIVIDNLDYLLPDSPDISALKILAAQRLNTTPPQLVIEQPPMLRAGLEAVLAFAAKNSDAVPEGSLLDTVATNQHVDLPWSSWTPAHKTSRASKQSLFLDTREIKEEANWVDHYVEDALENAVQFGHQIDIAQLAQDVKLPQRTIEHSLSKQQPQDFVIPPEENLNRIDGLGTAMARVLRRMGINTISDLAGLEESGIDRITHQLGHYANRIAQDNWIAQAQLMHNTINGQETDPMPTRKTTNAIGKTVNQTDLTGDGTIAQGPDAVALGAGAVLVGGSNSGDINTGTQTNINTGGGTYIDGGVDTGGGDFIGRDNITHGISSGELESLFAPLLALITQQLPPDQQTTAIEQTDALKTEIAKAEQSDDGRMAKIIDGLVDRVPGAVGAVIKMFATPILSGIVGPVTKYVLDKLKTD